MSFRTVFVATAVQPQKSGAEKHDGDATGGMGAGGIKDGPSLEEDGAWVGVGVGVCMMGWGVLDSCYLTLTGRFFVTRIQRPSRTAGWGRRRWARCCRCGRRPTSTSGSPRGN